MMDRIVYELAVGRLGLNAESDPDADRVWDDVGIEQDVLLHLWKQLIKRVTPATIKKVWQVMTTSQSLLLKVNLFVNRSEPPPEEGGDEGSPKKPRRTPKTPPPVTEVAEVPSAAAPEERVEGGAQASHMFGLLLFWQFDGCLPVSLVNVCCVCLGRARFWPAQGVLFTLVSGVLAVLLACSGAARLHVFEVLLTCSRRFWPAQVLRAAGLL